MVVTKAAYQSALKAHWWGGQNGFLHSSRFNDLPEQVNLCRRLKIGGKGWQ